MFSHGRGMSLSRLNGRLVLAGCSNKIVRDTCKSAQVVTKCSRLVAMLFQQLVIRMCSHCLFPALLQLATRFLSSTDLLQVVPTLTCYIVLQFVNNLSVSTLKQLDEITALLQLADKLVTSLLRTRLVDK